jgi:charged multivesicular body protein 3
MDEMMEDVLAADEDEELEAEADEEVDKVLFDLTEGRLGQAGAARTELPVCASFSVLALVLTRTF